MHVAGAIMMLAGLGALGHLAGIGFLTLPLILAGFAMFIVGMNNRPW